MVRYRPLCTVILVFLQTLCQLLCLHRYQHLLLMNVLSLSLSVMISIYLHVLQPVRILGLLILSRCSGFTCIIVARGQKSHIYNLVEFLPTHGFQSKSWRLELDDSPCDHDHLVPPLQYNTLYGHYFQPPIRLSMAAPSWRHASTYSLFIGICNIPVSVTPCKAKIAKTCASEKA